MSLKPWRRISGEALHRNPWWTYRLDRVRLPSGKEGEYHYVHTPGSAMVVPVLSDGRVLALNQYRYLAGRESIEFPCGSVQEGSDYDTTARKELLEETGYLADSMTAVGEFNPYNGVTDEMCRIYLARGLRHIGAEPEETEEFEMVPLLPHEFDERIRTGIVWDGMSIAGWHLIRAKGLI